MSEWNIYHKDDSMLTDVNGEKIIAKELEYSDSWMGECYLTVSFKNNAPIDFQIGDYIEYRGERFELNYDPGKEKQARKDSYGEAFVYDSVKFNSLQDELSRTEFLDVVLNDNGLHYTALPKFSFYVESLDDLLDRIQANLNEQIGEGKWKLFSRNLNRSEQRGCTEAEWNEAYGEGTSDITIDSKSLTIDTKKCREALALVNSEWDVNFIVRGRNIYVGTAGVPTANIFKYGLGNGLYQVDQNADSDQSIITRLRAYGSEQNLPSHYYADLGIKYKSNITKVTTAENVTCHHVEFLLDLDYIETYFKNKRTWNNGKDSNGWVLQVTFDYNTIITGYVSEDYTTKKCLFYSEVKNEDDTGDEPSQTNLDTFIDQVKAGNTLLYIASGINSDTIPYANKEYADNLPNNMAINRLMLPGFPHQSLKDYYDSLSDTDKAYVNPTGKEYRFSEDKYRPYIDSLNIDKIGLRSGSQFFDTDDKTNGIIDIYPTIEEMEIGGVRVDEIYEGVAPDDDGRFDDGTSTPKNVDICLSPSIDFDITDLKDDDFAISMKDGMCGGRTFNVAATNKVDGRWRLTIERVKDDALELYFPYKDYPIRKGDYFVLTGIKLPDSYVRAASLKLLKYALALLDKNDYTRYVYQPKVDEIFMARQHDTAIADKTGTIKSLHDTLKAGDIMLFEDEDLNIDGQISIDQLTIKEEEGKIPTYEVTLREDKEVGTIQKIQQQISSLESGNGGFGGGATTAQVKSLVSSEGAKYFISKITDDTAAGKITFQDTASFLKGLRLGDTGNPQITAEGLAMLYAFMTYNFNSGMYGTGASIDFQGNAELESLFVRKFISTPKFVFNEISVTKAEQWNTNGYGTIESVDTESHTIKLKLEENDYGSLAVGDICRGIFADIDNSYGSDSTEEGSTDDCNFVMHKGFFTTYFYVKRILVSQKGEFSFEYGKKSESTPDPCAFMDFAQYGSFTDTQRQSSMYFSSRGRSYIEVLDGVTTWEVKPENRVARYGWLGGLNVKKKNGTYQRLTGNGLYAQNNVYFGGNVEILNGLSDLEDLKASVNLYDVSLSQYQSVLTVDDMGNVINGLYTQDEEKATKQYRVSSAVFVRKGSTILLEEDDKNEDVTEGHFRVHAVSEECSVEVKNSTVFVTAINNVKDGVAGTDDDEDFDYDKMREMTDAMVTVVVDLEGKISKTVQMPIRIAHDSLPFMVCDLSNEHASLAWNTKAGEYVGLPVETTVCLMYHNEPWQVESVAVKNVPEGLAYTIADDGKGKRITLTATAALADDTLEQVSNIAITATGRYAGAVYEYTKTLTISKTSDNVVYELIPSSDSIVTDKDGNKSANSVACRVFATSSEDKRYELTTLPDGYAIKYSYDDNPTTNIDLGESVAVTSDDKMVTFALYDTEGNILDKESVPVLAYGKDGKGIEYVFKRTAGDTRPDNPTPEDYATNSDYQDTTKEYIPEGWTDDPTGVTAALPYEWVAVRTSTNGHWDAFSDPAEYAHYGKHAPSARCSDDIVTIPTDSQGNALAYFSEVLQFQLLVDGRACTLTSVVASGSLTNATCKISSYKATVYCSSGAALGKTSQTLVFTVKGTLDGASYSDTVTVKVVPNVTGEDGDGYEYVYYLSDSETAPSAPSRLANGSLTSGWEEDPMSPTDEKRYVYVAYRQGKLGAAGTFSTPKLFAYKAQDGEKGDTGNGIKNISTYYAISAISTTAPTSGWTTSMQNPTAANQYLWSYTKTTYTDGTSTSSTPVVIGNYAAGGKAGCTVRTSIWKSGATYRNDSYSDDEPKFLDVVYVENADASDGYDVYQCVKTHTATASLTYSNTTYWQKLSDVGPIYSPLIVAKNGVIKFAQSQQINLYKDNTMFGSFRTVTDDTDQALWLGGTSGASANFSVTKGGTLYAKNANVSGTINASKGCIGDLTIDSNGLNVDTWTGTNPKARQGTLVQRGSLYAASTSGGYKEVAAGGAAIIDPISDEWQTALGYDWTSSSSNASSNALLVRKYTNTANTGGVSISTSCSNSAYAALNVDTDESPGIRSLGINHLGAVAQTVISTSAITSAQQTAIDNNRVGLIVMTNSADTTVKLPKTPMNGQMIIMIQYNARFWVDPVDKTIWCGGVTRTTSNKFDSNTVGQFNIFIYDGTYWHLQYINNQA